MITTNYTINPFKIKDYYLYELASIPAEVRKSYIEKLLKRKNSGNQKNIILIKELSRIIESGNATNYDNGNLAQMLNISSRMLDCHKSRLLKGIRNFAFKNDRNEHYNNLYKKNIADAKEHIKKGLTREALKILLHVKSETGTLPLTPQILPDLFYTYEMLFRIYYYRKDTRKVNYYFKLIRIIGKKIERTAKIDNDTKNWIKIEFLLTNDLKLRLNRFRINDNYEALKVMKEAELLAKSLKDPAAYLRVLLRLGLISNQLKDNREAFKYFALGKKIAEENNFEQDKLVFSSHLDIKKFSEDNRFAQSALEQHKLFMNRILECYTDVQQILEIQFNYIRLLIYMNDETADDVTEDFVKRQILYSRKADALRSLYLEISDQLTSAAFKWQIKKGILSVKTDEDVLKLLGDMNRKSLLKYGNIYMPNILSIIYINCIEQEFWKAEKADFELADLYHAKLERLIKLYKSNISMLWIESAKAGLKIFEAMHSMQHEKLYMKFRKTIEGLIISMKSEKQSFNISNDFAKILFINSRINSRSLNQKTNELTAWMRKHRPEIMKAIEQLASNQA